MLEFEASLGSIVPCVFQAKRSRIRGLAEDVSMRGDTTMTCFAAWGIFGDHAGLTPNHWTLKAEVWPRQPLTHSLTSLALKSAWPRQPHPSVSAVGEKQNTPCCACGAQVGLRAEPLRYEGALPVRLLSGEVSWPSWVPKSLWHVVYAVAWLATSPSGQEVSVSVSCTRGALTAPS